MRVVDVERTIVLAKALEAVGDANNAASCIDKAIRSLDHWIPRRARRLADWAG